LCKELKSKGLKEPLQGWLVPWHSESGLSVEGQRCKWCWRWRGEGRVVFGLGAAAASEGVPCAVDVDEAGGGE
jgi:hypothetical protein